MFRVALAEQLKALGHDVARAGEAGMERADDADILARAIADHRTLVTLDGHFGDWAVLPLRAHPGVIRVKAHPTTTRNVLRVLAPFLAGIETGRLQDRLVIVPTTHARWVATAL